MSSTIDEIVITEGTGTRIICSRYEHAGVEYVSIAKQYKKKGDTSWSYTKQVVAVPVGQSKKLRLAIKKLTQGL